MKRRTPLRRLGKRGMAWVYARQSFLKTLLAGRERASFPCGTRIGADGGVYVDPSYAAEGEVEVWTDTSGTYPRYFSSGHVHHDVARSRAPERRLDPTNLVLLTVMKHMEVEGRFQKGGTGT